MAKKIKIPPIKLDLPRLPPPPKIKFEEFDRIQEAIKKLRRLRGL